MKEYTLFVLIISGILILSFFSIKLSYPTTVLQDSKTSPTITAGQTYNVKDIIEQMVNNPYPSIRQFYSNLFQQWYYDTIPESIIYQPKQMFGLSKNLTGVNPFLVQNYQDWRYNGSTSNSIIISVSMGFGTLNPIFSLAYTDKYVYNAIYEPLFELTANKSSNFNTWYPQPILVKSFAVSPDGLTWFVNLKQGLLWSDGIPLNASDVVFSYQKSLTFYYNYFSKDFAELFASEASISAVNSTCIKFQFTHETGYTIAQVFTIPILPQHIFAGLPTTQDAWQNDITNTGRGANRTWTFGSTTGSINGPTGNGPYLYNGYNSTEGSWNLVLNPNFQASLLGLSKPTIENIKIIVQTSNTVALASLNTKDIQFVDKNTGLAYIAEQLNRSKYAYGIPSLALSWQEVGYNHYSSIFGMNPVNPEILYNSNPSSNLKNGMLSGITRDLSWINSLHANTNNETWFYIYLNNTDRLQIREAMDYAIPRQTILTTILNESGILVNSPFLLQIAGYNSTIQPRPFDLGKAKDLLTKTFGYQYNASGNNYTGIPYFTLNIYVPSNDVVRVQFVQRIATIWLLLGINIALHISSLATINQILYFNQEAPPGSDYAHNGFDALFISMNTVHYYPDLRLRYESQFYSQYGGSNYNYVNSNILTYYSSQTIPIIPSSSIPSSTITATSPTSTTQPSLSAATFSITSVFLALITCGLVGVSVFKKKRQD